MRAAFLLLKISVQNSTPVFFKTGILGSHQIIHAFIFQEFKNFECLKRIVKFIKPLEVVYAGLKSSKLKVRQFMGQCQFIGLKVELPVVKKRNI